MNIKKNIVYPVDNEIGTLSIPDKSVQLIISDPPYFEVKGAFDFVFKDLDDYLSFMERQAQQYKRLLADNGSLFIYGHAKKIAYVQVIFDKYFNLENNITWDVIDRQTKKGMAGYRSFAPVTERILFYSNEITSVNGECVFPVRDYLRAEIIRVRGQIDYREINEVLGTASNGGGIANSILSLNKTEPAMITEQQYIKLRGWLNGLQTPALGREYSALRKEFEDLRRFFDNLFGLTDVFRFSQEGHNAAKYEHETMKPEALTRALILTTTRPGDTVYIPFSGSGTECAMCVKENREFYGFDINEKHATEANNRVNIHKQIKTLF